eukprot:ANDGO_07615.mRNA.1 hypothetical protein
MADLAFRNSEVLMRVLSFTESTWLQRSLLALVSRDFAHVCSYLPVSERLHIARIPHFLKSPFWNPSALCKILVSSCSLHTSKHTWPQYTDTLVDSLRECRNLSAIEFRRISLDLGHPGLLELFARIAGSACNAISSLEFRDCEIVGNPADTIESGRWRSDACSTLPFVHLSFERCQSLSCSRGLLFYTHLLHFYSRVSAIYLSLDSVSIFPRHDSRDAHAADIEEFAGIVSRLCLRSFNCLNRKEVSYLDLEVCDAISRRAAVCLELRAFASLYTSSVGVDSLDTILMELLQSQGAHPVLETFALTAPYNLSIDILSSFRGLLPRLQSLFKLTLDCYYDESPENAVETDGLFKILCQKCKQLRELSVAMSEDVEFYSEEVLSSLAVGELPNLMGFSVQQLTVERWDTISASWASGLRRLDVTVATAGFFGHLATVLRASKLEAISVVNCSFVDEKEAKVFGRALCHSHVSRVSLRLNGLDDELFECLFLPFATEDVSGKSLRMLDIGSQLITESSFPLLARVLSANAALEVFEISDCGFVHGPHCSVLFGVLPQSICEARIVIPQPTEDRLVLDASVAAGKRCPRLYQLGIAFEHPGPLFLDDFTRDVARLTRISEIDIAVAQGGLSSDSISIASIPLLLPLESNGRTLTFSSFSQHRTVM